jgi:DNA-binding transcriptional ArsR family regulator
MFKVNQTSYALVIKRLLEDEASISDLEEASGLHRKTVEKLMRIFKEHKLVYVSDYLPDKMGRDSYKVYSWGKGKDKERYRQTGKERQRKCREMKRRVSLHPTSLLSI